MQTHFAPAQLTDPDTAASARIIRGCVHCGFCTATCPTYVLLGDELDSPRGRIYLIKEMLENGRAASAPIVRHIDRCLSCLACMTSCPSGVNYQHLIDHARVHVERTYPRPLPDRLWRALLARVLPYPGRLRVALGLARTLQRLLGMLPARAAAVLGRMPASLQAALALAARVPAPARERRPRSPAKEDAPAVHAPESRGRVALLRGCAPSVLAPQIESASARVLERAGFEVVRIPGCCGALVHHMGRRAQAHELAAALLARVSAAGPLDAVAVTASGCGTHLKDLGYQLRGDSKLAAPAARLAAATRDVSELIYAAAIDGTLDFTVAHRAGGPAGLVVAYHSACSMQHGQHLEEPPRRLLTLAGMKLREIPESHLCCGSAGVYNLLEPRIAQALRARKLANLERTGAALVATGNLGCALQLGDPARPVLHSVELLDWALGGQRPPGCAAS